MPVRRQTTAGRRIDLLLVEKGLAENQARAQAIILAGKVTAGGRAVTKAGTLVSVDAVLEVAAP